MADDSDPGPPWVGGIEGAIPALFVPEIRDYQRVNLELAALLDAGHRRVRLVGVEGQRLLVSGLRGSWVAVVELEGRAGPELAAGLDAPGLTVVCRGPALDGVGSGMADGLLVVQGPVGTAAGYSQRGGTIVVVGAAGPRAGLDQSGGVLVLGAEAGRLAGERQSGGHLFALAHRLGPHAGLGWRGGRLVTIDSLRDTDRPLDPSDGLLLTEALTRAWPWIESPGGPAPARA